MESFVDGCIIALSSPRSSSNLLQHIETFRLKKYIDNTISLEDINGLSLTFNNSIWSLETANDNIAYLIPQYHEFKCNNQLVSKISFILYRSNNSDIVHFSPQKNYFSFEHSEITNSTVQYSSDINFYNTQSITSYIWDINLVYIPIISMKNINCNEISNIPTTDVNNLCKTSMNFLLTILRAMKDIGSFHLVDYSDNISLFDDQYPSCPNDMFPTESFFNDFKQSIGNLEWREGTNLNRNDNINSYIDEKTNIRLHSNQNQCIYKQNHGLVEKRNGSIQLGKYVTEEMGDSCDTALEYFIFLEKLSNFILHCLALGNAVGMSHVILSPSSTSSESTVVHSHTLVDKWRDLWREDSYLGLRGLAYHPGPSTDSYDNAIVTTDIHLDASWITLLLTDDCDGLEIYSLLYQKWITVKSLSEYSSGTYLLVNAGSVLSNATIYEGYGGSTDDECVISDNESATSTPSPQQGIQDIDPCTYSFYKAVNHRVMRYKSCEHLTRISMPFFYKLGSGILPKY
jgi:hypothetical protein